MWECLLAQNAIGFEFSNVKICFVNLRGRKKWLPLTALICISLLTNGDEHLFTCSLAIWISSCVNCPFCCIELDISYVLQILIPSYHLILILFTFIFCQKIVLKNHVPDNLKITQVILVVYRPLLNTVNQKKTIQIAHFHTTHRQPPTDDYLYFGGYASRLSSTHILLLVLKYHH